MLKRLDVSARSMIALVEHGSCFAGVLAEILWAVDRSYMMENEFEGDNRPLATVTLTDGNFGAYNATNGAKLWAISLGSGISAPPVTYSVDGKQYVSLLVGWGGAGLIASSSLILKSGGSTGCA